MKTFLNNYGIASIEIDITSNEKRLIQVLKENGFRYFKGCWTVLGFNDLSRFECYVIACINNDTKEKNKNKPFKTVEKEQMILLHKLNNGKRNTYVQDMKKKLFDIVCAEMDFKTAAFIENYVTEKRIDFWKWYNSKNNTWDFRDIVSIAMENYSSIQEL